MKKKRQLNYLTEIYNANYAAGILPICKTTGRVLVGLRSKDVDSSFTWGIFGGMVENYDDSLTHSALRELKEETGYNNNIKLIKAFTFRGKGLIYQNYLGIVDEEFIPRINWEHDEIKWVALFELKNQRNIHTGLKALLINSKDLIERFINPMKANNLGLKESIKNIDITFLNPLCRKIESQCLNKGYNNLELEKKLNQIFFGTGIYFECTFDLDRQSAKLAEVGLVYASILLNGLVEIYYNSYFYQTFEDKNTLYRFFDVLKQIISHEFTHRKHLLASRGQIKKLSPDYTNDEYLSNDSEIIAHAQEAVQEYIDLGYNRKEIMQLLKIPDIDTPNARESDAFYKYYDYYYTSFDGEESKEEKKVWNKFLKSIYSILQSKSNLKEMPLIAKKGRTLFANNIELKKLTVDDVLENIVFFREGEGNFLFGKGATWGYFMDSKESANKLKSGEYKMLLFPLAPRYNFDIDVINDIWKIKYKTKGSEHILAVWTGYTDEGLIVIDKLSVRKGYRKNSIASKMFDFFRKVYPDAEINITGVTKDGAEFVSKYTNVPKIDLKRDGQQGVNKFDKELNLLTETESLEFNSWKRKNITLRGIKDRYKENNAGARFGDGLYTAFLGNKKMARQYGKVYYVLNAIPKTPKVVQNVDEAEIFIQTIISNFCKGYGKEYDPRFFSSKTEISKEALKLGYDGLVIKGREMVNYDVPDNVKYFETLEQLKRYYNDFVSN